jgi:hypothetical protein
VAKVTSKQRQKTESKTGDPSFPMETGAQIESAIRLRGKGKSKGPGQVLRLASAAVSRLLKAGKISAELAAKLRTMIQNARGAK